MNELRDPRIYKDYVGTPQDEFKKEIEALREQLRTSLVSCDITYRGKKYSFSQPSRIEDYAPMEAQRKELSDLWMSDYYAYFAQSILEESNCSVCNGIPIEDDEDFVCDHWSAFNNSKHWINVTIASAKPNKQKIKYIMPGDFGGAPFKGSCFYFNHLPVDEQKNILKEKFNVEHEYVLIWPCSDNCQNPDIEKESKSLAKEAMISAETTAQNEARRKDEARRKYEARKAYEESLIL